MFLYIANFWPGMNNIIVLNCFVDLCEWGSFDNIVVCTLTFQMCKLKKYFPFFCAIVVL